jgi:hypothetical protein
MLGPMIGRPPVNSRGWNGPRRSLRISFQAGAWRLSEDGVDRIGGIFTSLSAAIAYARSELRGVPGGVALDYDGASFDGEP